jgi:hypothetical protein
MKQLLLLYTFLLLPWSLSAQAPVLSGKSQPFTLDFKPATNVPVAKAESVNGIKILWMEPITFSSTTDKKVINIKIGINSENKVTSITLYLNDEPVQQRGVRTSKKTDFDEVFEADISLKNGDNRLRLVVETIGGKGTSERVVTYQRAVGEEMYASRTDYALLFAINEYNEWKPLINPVKDAETIAEELEKTYGFKVDLVLNPTADEVMSKLREYSLKSYFPKDQLFIFFAGHGHFDEAFGEGYIVAKDSRNNDKSMNSYIAHSRLRSVVNNIPSDHILLVMDACFGGTFDPLIAKGGHRGADEDFVLTTTEMIERKLRFKTRRYMTSGGKEYVPDGRPGSHSPFARKFLEALRSYGGKDKILTINEIQTYLEMIRPEPRSGEFGENEPGSDFIFVAK